MSKKKSEKTYEEIFSDHINNIQDYENKEKLYTSIKNKYIDLIEKNEILIPVERARLESKINMIKNTSIPNYISFIILAVGMLCTGIITAYTQYSGIINNYFLILGFTISMFITIIVAGYTLSKEFVVEDKENVTFKLCLRVLDDIGKEMQEGKLLQDFAEDEVTATLEENDKEKKKRAVAGKNIYELFNIVTINKVDKKN